MAETSDKEEKKATVTKGFADKAAKAVAAEDDVELERPKMPTGKFVAATPLQVWDPTLKKGAGGRRIVGIG